MKDAFGQSFEMLSPAPVPSADIFLKTNAKEEAFFERKACNTNYGRNVYLSSGYNTARLLLQAARDFGFKLSTMETAFELGCGDGRVLRHLRGVKRLRLIGSDTRQEAINWCRATLSNVEFYVNDFDPPLAFLRDAEVDLVVAYSVFTHVPLEKQPAWLAELARVVRPGGLLLLTVMSDSIKACLPANRRRELEQKGELEISADDEAAHLATRVGGSPVDVYQTRDRILKTFGTRFEILGYIRDGRTISEPSAGAASGLGQDLVVLRNVCGQR